MLARRSSTSTALPLAPIPLRDLSAATADTTTVPSRTTDRPARMAPWAVSPPSTVSIHQSHLWRVSQAACELCSVQFRTDAFVFFFFFLAANRFAGLRLEDLQGGAFGFREER